MATEVTVKKGDHAIHHPEMQEIDLRATWNLIKSSYKLIVIITMFFLICGIYYAETRSPVYQSEAMIQVGNNDLESAINSGNGGAAMLSGLAGQSSDFNIETILLQSPYVLEKVVRQMGLAISVSPYYSGFFARKWAEFRHINSGNITLSTLEVPDSLLSKKLILTVNNQNQYSLMTKNGKIILRGVTGVMSTGSYFSQPLTIKVTKIDARPGEQFELIKQQITDVSNDIASALSIKEEGENTGIMKIQYISGSREQAQSLLNAILSAAVEKNIKEKSQEAAKTLQFISDQLPISKNQLEKTENKFNRYGIKTGVFDPKSASQELLKDHHLLQQSLEKMKFDKMLLLQKFTSLHPLVIAETKKENLLQSEIKKNQEKLAQLPPVEEKESAMERDAKIDANIYTGLALSVQKVEMMKASMISSVRILSSATYPISRIPVKKRVIIFGNAILGLMASLLLIFTRHLLSPVIHDPDLVERMLNLAVVAIIPYSQRQLDYNKKAKRSNLYANAKPFLLSRENPNDISIEGIRSLRTSIQMSLLDAKNNVIALTGCSPGVGKSFISSNLAALLSDLEKRTIIVDADIRLGKLSQCFGKAKTPGLSTYLKNEVALDQIIQNIIPSKLDFIATGLYPENPSELLTKDKLKDLIETLKNNYDLVIFDTPPILAVTDPALILRFSATNFMVLGVGKDHMREILHAKKILEKNGVILSGVIFNTLNQQKSGFGHNYGYENYSYEYGTGKK